MRFDNTALISPNINETNPIIDFVIWQIKRSLEKLSNSIKSEEH